MEFRTIAIQHFLQFNKGTIKNFNCSAGFINDFKKRHGISSRKAHFKRRPVVSEEAVIEWKQKIRNLLNNIDNDYILNVDETNWMVYPNNLKTWAPTGNDSIQISINGNDKENFTCLATVSASGKKFPLQIIATGKTGRCEKGQILQYLEENQNDIWATHSKSGWSTIETFSKYLENLRNLFGENPIYLVLDSYSVHRSIEIKSKADELKIELIFIPPGMTDRCQPLDLRVFGTLKSISRRLYRQAQNQETRKKADAVVDIIRAWKSISEELIISSWNEATS